MTDAIVYCDGLCEPRKPGGVAAYGWAAYWKGKPAREGYGVVCEGDGATNNVAEYSAVINALKFFLSKNFKGPLIVRSDSQLVINQMAGAWAVKSPSVFPYFEEAQNLARQFTQIIYEWVPREKNATADELSRKAYREYQNKKRR